MKRKPIVVIVEDDEQLQEILQESLWSHDFHVVVLGTASLADFKSACTTAPDVLVCDLNLPGGRGEDLCRAVLELYPGCEAILMTGSSCSVGPFPAQIKPPMLLHKPFTLHTFLNAVTRLIESGMVGAEPCNHWKN